MEAKSLIHSISRYIPATLLDELEYVSSRYEAGQEDGTRLRALVDDAIRFLEDSRVAPVVKKRTVGAEVVRYINEVPENKFSLLSEPSEQGFYGSHHDVMKDIEIYRPDNPLEKKGRLYRPLYISDYPDFALDETNTLGVDVAGGGNDKSVLINQVGGHVTDIQSYYEQDIVGRVVNNIDEHNPKEVIIDMTGGWGSGLYNALLDLGIDALCVITPVVFNGSPRDERLNAANQRAEMFLLLQEKFRFGLITIPPHKELVEELTWIKYLPSPIDGKFRIEDKKKCKQRNKRSPDHADALALAFYYTGGLDLY